MKQTNIKPTPKTNAGVHDLPRLVIRNHLHNLTADRLIVILRSPKLVPRQAVLGRETTVFLLRAKGIRTCWTADPYA